MERRQLGRGRPALRGGDRSLSTRCLVTGGTGRLGAPLVSGLRERGWRVVAAGRADGDVSRADDARALVERAAAELGGLDVVVNAAAGGWRVQPPQEVTEADWDAALGATVKGTFFVSLAAERHLRATRGLVVVVEDVAAELPWTNLAPHAAAKAAQAHLTRILARAFAPDVRVCGVAPGPVAVAPEHAAGRAERTLLGRVGSPDDVVDAVSYLAGAAYVTGATLVVDGGRRLRTAPVDP
ncbi:MAG TPA: SDR family oxidoreductase [Gaiellaceae bacterium]|nr:SDR family oxidoreductase [Gaiellaceae bacterium]